MKQPLLKMSRRISIFNKKGEHHKDLKLIDSNDKSINEKRIQEIIFNKPELLTTSELDSEFNNLISLKQEFPISSGSIDVLLISPKGNLCVVETKLWRNSEAHRTVIAQVLDYAMALAMLSPMDIYQKVTKEKGESARIKFFEKINKAIDLNEIEFEDNLLQSLQDGRFLLLIVGDQIKPNLLLLSNTIQSAPHLQFNINLLELRLYEDDSDMLVVVPQLVGKTVEETRAVVKIQFEEKRPYVEVTSIEDPQTGKGITTSDEFVSSMPDGFRDIFIPYYEDWIEKRYPIIPGTKGMTIRFSVEGKKKTIFEIYPSSTIIYSKKLETKRDLPHKPCQNYRDNIKKSNKIDNLVSQNRQYVQYKDISIEDFTIHMNAVSILLDECARYYKLSE
jgi:hypothetical protein